MRFPQDPDPLRRIRVLFFKSVLCNNFSIIFCILWMSTPLVLTQDRRRDPPRPTNLPRIQTVLFDYIGSARTLPELTDQVPTIVSVVVTDLLVTYYWPGTDVRPQRGSMIVSDIEVVVTNSIKGEFVEGDSLVVLAIQGTLDQVTQTVDPTKDNPDMKVGESYILFLLPEENNVPDEQLPLHGIPRFTTFNGSLGRFRVEGGLIKPVNSRSEIQQEFEDRPVSEFVEAILENIAGRRPQ